MKKITISTALLSLVLTVSSVHAQAVPAFINYQGRVTDSAGTGLGTGTPVNRKMIFRLFDAPTAGNRVWSEEQTVTVANGEFSVLLGNGIAATYNSAQENPRPSLLAAFGSTDRYLELVVDDGDGTLNTTDTPIAPRQRLTCSAYAVRAATADSVASGTSLTLNDANSGLGYYGTSPNRSWNGQNIDGPVLYGNNGGALGSTQGNTQNTAIRWDSAGRVGIGNFSPTEKLDVTGNLKVSGTGTFGGALTMSGGVAVPAGDAGGPGMRLTLYPGGGGAPPYGFGIEDSTLFSIVPASASFKWYGGTDVKMTLQGATGNLSTAGSLSTGGNITTQGDIAVNGQKVVTLFDANHGLGYFGEAAQSPKSSFAGTDVNGPVLFGYSGGALGSTNGGQKIALQWDGAQNLSAKGNLNAAGTVNSKGKPTVTGEEELRIIRGTVTGNGTILAGSGFTVSGDSGTRVINLSSAFSGTPSVTATPYRTGRGEVCQIGSVSNSSFTIWLSYENEGSNSGSNENFGVSFIAVGPR